MMFNKKLWILFAVVCGLVIYTAILDPLLTSHLMCDIDNKNKFASFMSDYFGLFLNATTLIVLFLAFFDQTRNNEISDINNRFYELLKIHRENTNEMDLANSSGKKVFLLLLKEFREILRTVQSAVTGTALNQKQVIEIAYTIFYYGVGTSSDEQLKEPLAKYESFMERILNSVRALKSNSRSASNQGFGYAYVDGHQIRLGHYYRNLFQLFDFIDSNPALTADQKKNYLKTLRAQLTTHEQAMLYLNSLSEMGRPWWTRSFITKYRVVSNIPLGFFDKNTEIDIIADFDDKYFEHQHRGS